MRHLAVSAGLLLFSAFAAGAAVYTVRPDGTGDFPTIQAAVTAAEDGDTVELTAGTFTGPGNRDIDFCGKSITLRSQSGDPGSCVLDCQGSEAHPYRAFFFHSGEGPGTWVSGITITSGVAAGT